MSLDNLSGWYGWEDAEALDEDCDFNIWHYQPLYQPGKCSWPRVVSEICEGCSSAEQLLADYLSSGWDMTIHAIHADEVRMLLLEAAARKALGN